MTWTRVIPTVLLWAALVSASQSPGQAPANKAAANEGKVSIAEEGGKLKAKGGQVLKDIYTASAGKQGAVQVDHLMKGLVFDADTANMMWVTEIANDSAAPVDLQHRPVRRARRSKQLAEHSARSRGLAVIILPDGAQRINVPGGGRLAAVCPMQQERSTADNPWKCEFYPFAPGSSNIAVTVVKSFTGPDSKPYGPGKYKFVAGQLVPAP